MQPPVPNMNGLWTIFEEEAVMQMLAYSFIGSQQKIKAMLTDFVAQTGVNEIMASSHIYDRESAAEIVPVVCGEFCVNTTPFADRPELAEIIKIGHFFNYN